jgi:hypothetical protein
LTRVTQVPQLKRRGQNLFPLISGIRGQSYFFARLRKKFLSSTCVATEIVVVVVLGGINFLPGLLDQLLGGSHVSVAFTNVNSGALREGNYTKCDDG